MAPIGLTCQLFIWYHVFKVRGVILSINNFCTKQLSNFTFVDSHHPRFALLTCAAHVLMLCVLYIVYYILQKKEVTQHAQESGAKPGSFVVFTLSK